MMTKMKTITVSIDDSTLERLDRLLAGDRSRRASRSSLIRIAVREYVASIEKSIEEQREREVFKRRRKRLERQAVALIREQARS